MEFGKMDDFSLSDLAGWSAIIFASCGGLITVFLSSRCLIKCRLGFTDDCNICMCERKPPPDNEDVEQQNKKDNNEKDDIVEQQNEKIIPNNNINIVEP